MILLDTHVFYWWLGEPSNLSQTAREWIDRCEAGKCVVCIPVIALWELESKRRTGKLVLRCPLRDAWPTLAAIKGVEWLTPSVDDWLLAAELVWGHRDPADRLIAAIALNRGVAVLTKDRAFHQADSPVQALW